MTDERWKECCHHHHGCACREHQWEEKVAKLEAERDALQQQVNEMTKVIAADTRRMLDLDGYRHE